MVRRVRRNGTWRDRRAFTLLELVVALAVAAIIAAFAMPGYRSQIVRSHRTEAMVATYRAAQFVDAQSAGAEFLPAGLDQAPQSGTAVYRLDVLPGDETNGGYVIEARPISSGPMRDDPCGIFRLDATGARTNEPPDGQITPGRDECWRER